MLTEAVWDQAGAGTILKGSRIQIEFDVLDFEDRDGRRYITKLRVVRAVSDSYQAGGYQR